MDFFFFYRINIDNMIVRLAAPNHTQFIICIWVYNLFHLNAQAISFTWSPSWLWLWSLHIIVPIELHWYDLYTYMFHQTLWRLLFTLKTPLDEVLMVYQSHRALVQDGHCLRTRNRETKAKLISNKFLDKVYGFILKHIPELEICVTCNSNTIKMFPVHWHCSALCP